MRVMLEDTGASCRGKKGVGETHQLTRGGHRHCPLIYLGVLVPVPPLAPPASKKHSSNEIRHSISLISPCVPPEPSPASRELWCVHGQWMGGEAVVGWLHNCLWLQQSCLGPKEQLKIAPKGGRHFVWCDAGSETLLTFASFLSNDFELATSEAVSVGPGAGRCRSYVALGFYADLSKAEG